MFTTTEVVGLRAFYNRVPFDDESTFHVPAASLAAMYVNANRDKGSEPVSLSDFLVFRPAPDEDEADAELDTEIIEFMKRFKDP